MGLLNWMLKILVVIESLCIVSGMVKDIGVEIDENFFIFIVYVIIIFFYNIVLKFCFEFLVVF